MQDAHSSSALRPDREDLLNVKQVCQRLNMSPQWVYNHLDRCEPRLPFVRFGSAVKFKPTAIDRFILQQENAPRRRKRRLQ